jgi:hypothetical protein
MLISVTLVSTCSHRRLRDYNNTKMSRDRRTGFQVIDYNVRMKDKEKMFNLDVYIIVRRLTL